MGSRWERRSVTQTEKRLEMLKQRGMRSVKLIVKQTGSRSG
jgi:hypothetical protein